MMYNPDNYFINDNNYYFNVATTITLEYQKKRLFNYKKFSTNEIVDEYITTKCTNKI